MIGPKQDNYLSFPVRSDTNKLFFGDRFVRTPEGYEKREGVLFNKCLLSYQEMTITSKTISVARKKPSKVPLTLGRRLTGCQKLSKIYCSLISRDNLKKKTYTGLMTEGAKRRFQKSFDYLLFNSRPYWTIDPLTGKSRQARMTAWTLTMPVNSGIITGKAFWKLWNLFLTRLNRQGVNFLYIAKLETQENGQPHLHFNVTQYLKYDTIYSTWRSTLDHYGYLQPFLDANPGTDIQGAKFRYLWNDRCCSHYLWSYLKKSTQNKYSLQCRLWSCSEALKSPPTLRISYDNEQCKLLRSSVAAGKSSFKETAIHIDSRGCKTDASNAQSFKYLIKESFLFSDQFEMGLFLTTTNKRILHDYRQCFLKRLPMPDSRSLIFSRRYFNYIEHPRSTAIAQDFKSRLPILGGPSRILHGKKQKISSDPSSSYPCLFD